MAQLVINSVLTTSLAICRGWPSAAPTRDRHQLCNGRQQHVTTCSATVIRQHVVSTSRAVTAIVIVAMVPISFARAAATAPRRGDLRGLARADDALLAAQLQ